MPRRGQDVIWGDDSGISGVDFDEPPITEDVESDSSFSDQGESIGTGVGGDGNAADEIPGHPDEGRPKRTFQRKSVADLFAFAWGTTGTILTQTQIDPAVGRVMAFQAPVVGAKVDAVIEGTFIDKLVQPIVDKGDAAKGTFSVLALPFVIALFERNPGNPLLGQIAYNLVEENITELIPVMMRERVERKRNTKLLNEFSEMFELPPGVDPAAFVLNHILTGGVTEQPQQQEWEDVS
ncbi:MAG: hypothetical protein KGL39_52880 [Patescibacteria group bacterium]|nr:hypothetical protein [Patescibacteria group bacterium]